MNPSEQLIRLAEGQKRNMEHFVEHMQVILHHVEDNLTKELLSHLVEEEEERAAAITELIERLREWQTDGAAGAGSAGAAEDGRSVGADAVQSTGGDRRLTVGSLIQY
ncbi:hypothetical protein [Effusibacillus pohliae]|uniref:hypothetical protein n=1 Tax=Effusibacillus pohliae TaxID=232270 RepID=UPI0003630D45|nr:hypothetical protein [Effusibacillus pohliae]